MSEQIPRQLDLTDRDGRELRLTRDPDGLSRINAMCSPRDVASYGLRSASSDQEI